MADLLQPEKGSAYGETATWPITAKLTPKQGKLFPMSVRPWIVEAALTNFVQKRLVADF